jgi:hypothetical protein
MVPLSPRALAERSLIIVLSRINDTPFVPCPGRKKRTIMIDPLTDEKIELEQLNEKAVTRAQRYHTKFSI